MCCDKKDILEEILNLHTSIYTFVMDEFKKRQATAKGNLTELISQVEIQEAIEPPNLRDFSVLNRQFELLNRAEEAHQNNHSNLLDGSLDLEEEQLH